MKSSTLAVPAMLAILLMTAPDLRAGGACCGGETPSANAAVKPQTTCPVMGGKINDKLFVDIKGYRIYVCCEGCIDELRKAPDKYLAKIRESGATPESAPKVLCGQCGQLKGSTDCCKTDAVRCKCGLIKGSPGCCKITRGEDTKICPCGAIKGTSHCCNPGAGRQ